jgi:hypothetical protein
METPMATDRGYPADDEPLAPEDVDSAPSIPDSDAKVDPNDEVPVPIAMSPAEVDERAQVVDKLRHESPDTVDRESDSPGIG